MPTNIEDALFEAFSKGKDSNELLAALAKAEQRWQQEEERKRIEEAKRVEAEAKAKEERAKRITEIANRAINGKLTREDMDYMDKIYADQFRDVKEFTFTIENPTFGKAFDELFGLRRNGK